MAPTARVGEWIEKGARLTVNSPVTASKPTCMVCSKSEGGEISGLSLSLSFFLPPESKHMLDDDETRITSTARSGTQKWAVRPFSDTEKMEKILLRGVFSSGTEGRGLELWLADSESLPELVLKMVLLILTGGAGGLSSASPLSHIALGSRDSGKGWRTQRWAHTSMCAHVHSVAGTWRKDRDKMNDRKASSS